MITFSPLHLILAATLTASPTADPSTCSPTDHRCTAEANVAAARAATSDSERTHRLYRAHRAYLALARSAAPSERAGLLCRAAELLGQARALPPLESLRRLLVDTAKETTDALAGIDCSPPKKQRKGAGRRVVTTVPATTTPSMPASPATANTQDPPSASDSAVLLAVRAGRRAVEPTAAAPLATGPTSHSTPVVPSPSEVVMKPRTTSPAIQADHAPRRGRDLMITGGVTLGVGLALAGVATYTGSRMIAARDDARDLDNSVDGFASDVQLAQDARLIRDYERMGRQTLALALTGGATVMVAAILLGVGGRRMARAVSRAAFIPAPGGLVLRARF